MINNFIIILYMITPATLIAQTNTQQTGNEDPDINQEDGYWESYSQSPSSGNIGKEVTKDVNIKNIVSVSDDYTYASFGRPDPFVPPLLSSHITQLEIPIVSILQKYRLDELRVVGIWTLENNARKALMTSSNDEGVIVTIGDHAGNRGGKIIAIEPEVVKVREFTLAPDGTRQFNDRELWLGDEMPEGEEKLFIKSTSKPLDDESSYSGQDFLDTTDQEQNRVNKLMGTSTEGNAEENLGEDRDTIKEKAPEAPFQSDSSDSRENVNIPNNVETKKVIEGIGKKLPIEAK